MYSKEDKEQAKNLIANKPLMEFLTKYLIEPQVQWSASVLDMADSQLATLVKADVLAQQKILQRFGEIKKMATETGGSPSPIAPK